MDGTIEKYREYVMTGFVKSVQPLVIDRASGAIVTDSEGRQYIDAFAGIAVVNAGHGNPEVLAAAHAQMDRLVHCCSYLYHVRPVGDLAEKLAQVTPGRLKKSFFTNSGAEAVEGAIKLAKLHTGRSEIVALAAGFHGRTWGAASVTGNMGRKRRGGPYAPGVAFAPAPVGYRDWGQALEDTIRFCTSGDVAAFIAEPILGEGGILVPPPEYFGEIKRILDRHGILFIADEVQTGFGRTGSMFAIEEYDLEPDILVMAKGIAAGFPLGAFTVREEIAAAYRPGDHLSTFGGNPVSCAAALASIEFIEREGLCEKARSDGEYALSELEAMRDRFSIIDDVRGRGLMIGVELLTASAAEDVRESMREAGVLIGVGGIDGNVVRIQPPLVIDRDQIDRVLQALDRALARAEAHSGEVE